jgi:hypothetical protein
MNQPCVIKDRSTQVDQQVSKAYLLSDAIRDRSNRYMYEYMLPEGSHINNGMIFVPNKIGKGLICLGTEHEFIRRLWRDKKVEV